MGKWIPDHWPLNRAKILSTLLGAPDKEGGVVVEVVYSTADDSLG
jgi:hypothetical protein